MKPKPKMTLDPKKDINGFCMIERAVQILESHGLKATAAQINQKATVRGYNTYHVFRLLKEFMDI